MVHRGEIVEKAVRESGYSITKLAQKLGKSRRHLYNMFENSKLDIETIWEIGKILHHDFSKNFPELKRPEFTGTETNIVQEREGTFVSMGKKYDLQTALSELDHWKNKYIELLEVYNQALLSLAQKSSAEKKAKK